MNTAKKQKQRLITVTRYMNKETGHPVCEAAKHAWLSKSIFHRRLMALAPNFSMHKHGLNDVEDKLVVQTVLSYWDKGFSLQRSIIFETVELLIKKFPEERRSMLTF